MIPYRNAPFQCQEWGNFLQKYWRLQLAHAQKTLHCIQGRPSSKLVAMLDYILVHDSKKKCHDDLWYFANAGILLIGPLVTIFSEISIEIYTFSFTKTHLKISSGKWRPFCLDLNVLTGFQEWTEHILRVAKLTRKNRMEGKPWKPIRVSTGNYIVFTTWCYCINLVSFEWTHAVPHLVWGPPLQHNRSWGYMIVSRKALCESIWFYKGYDQCINAMVYFTGWNWQTSDIYHGDTCSGYILQFTILLNQCQGFTHTYLYP